MINDIDENYIKIGDDLTTSEIATDEDIVKDIMTSKQLEPNIGDLDDDFGYLHLIFKDAAALRILEKFYYSKYEIADAERNALLVLEALVDTK